MDSTEIHYLTYDSEEMYKEMQAAYLNAGGDVLWPGDEKEMLLRAVLAVLVQGFAGVDNALRMATRRYAVGDYLDIYGEGKDCARIEAAAATATVEIKFEASGKAGTIAAGTALTADGEILYTLDEDVERTGYAQTVTASITASTTGSAGNGLVAGTQMQFLTPETAVESVYCVTDASGGQEEEDDETYRERIGEYGLANITTGPEEQYEAAAKAVTSEILDAAAVRIGDGQVGVYLLLESDTGSAAIIENVAAALNGETERPLTDSVTVALAEAVPYTLNVQYRLELGETLETDITTVVSSYQEWQDNTIGRAFNPDRLVAAIYQAGASRVILADGSNLDGGDAVYTEIGGTKHCKGTITLEVLT